MASIEGIGGNYAKTLKESGIVSVETLLNAGAEKASRVALAAKTGISEKLLLNGSTLCFSKSESFLPRREPLLN